MKKIVLSVLSIMLISILCCTSSYAASYSDCAHVGNKVKALEDGYINIAFDNGYNGFCICYGDEQAYKDDSFTIANMELAVNHNSGQNISEHLKILFVKYFDTFFEVDATNTTCSLTNTIAMQHTIWAFSNDFSGWRVDPNMVNDIKQTVMAQTMPIPDHGYTKKINATTQAIFDFHVLKSDKGAHQQNFWSYKITLVPYPAPKFTSPTTSQTIDVIDGTSTNLSATATNAESYQWQVDKGDGNGFVNIPNATGTAYTTPEANSNNSNYKYRCVATNTAGQDISHEFSLKLITKPVFTEPTDSQTKDAYLGQAIELTANATDADFYQWQVDKGDGNGFVDIPNATGASYTTPEANDDNIGYKYRCVASNRAGDTTSHEFTLKLVEKPADPKPTEPAKPTDNKTGTGSQNQSSTPNTGDWSHTGLYLLMMIVSLGTVIGFFCKKFNYK